MSKIIISYQTVEEREQIIKALSTGVKINKISKPYRKGIYKRIYVYIN